jgi:hypothetical protein
MHVIESQELTGVIHLQPGENKFIDCWSGVPGLGGPTFDFGGEGQSLELLGFCGGAKFQNKSGPERARLDITSGRIWLDETMNGTGEVVAHGMFHATHDGTCPFKTSEGIDMGPHAGRP